MHRLSEKSASVHIDMHTRVARARRDLVHMAGRVAAPRAALSGRWRISLENILQSTIFTPIFPRCARYARGALRAQAPLRGGMHIPTHITKVGASSDPLPTPPSYSFMNGPRLDKLRVRVSCEGACHPAGA